MKKTINQTKKYDRNCSDIQIQFSNFYKNMYLLKN